MIGQYHDLSHPLHYKKGLEQMGRINKSSEALWSTLNQSDLTNKKMIERKKVSHLFSRLQETYNLIYS